MKAVRSGSRSAWTRVELALQIRESDLDPDPQEKQIDQFISRTDSPPFRYDFALTRYLVTREQTCKSVTAKGLAQDPDAHRSHCVDYMD